MCGRPAEALLEKAGVALKEENVEKEIKAQRPEVEEG